MRHLGLAGAALLAACGNDALEIGTAPGSLPVVETIAPVSKDPTRMAVFGDLHIHTANSFDAFIFGTRATPDDAYRFAAGEAIDNGAGASVQLAGPPLDFIAVTDHGEYMGIVPAMADRGSALSETDTARSIFGLLATDRRANFLRIGQTVVTGDPIEDIYDRSYIDSVWADTVAAAERHYRPGEMTTFAGYEFTAMQPVDDTMTAALNLHRNVIFKGDAPARLFTTLDSPNPEDLWDWMDAQRAQGREVLSIPHNSNASNGRMFADTTYLGEPLSLAYAQQRMRNEPIVEITQLKGTSETHPALSPNDEWADFELYSNLIGSTGTSDPVSGSFVREALARSLSLPGRPFEVGVIGSSDTHIAGGAFTEEDFFGKFPHDLDNDNRRSVPANPRQGWAGEPDRSDDLIATPQYGASGLAGVWTTSNTREAIFDAMDRRETFATSGPRIRVRLFAGDYAPSLAMRADALETLYADGVPMGSETTGAPDFVAVAAADANSDPLERMQMIVLRQDGSEEIHDIACAGGAPIDPDTRRCELPTGAVDVSTCEASGAGAGELRANWRDADARPGERAAYYVRVLERPKCRWSTWDAVRAGTEPSPALPATIQDRAWSSPIWVDAN